MSLAELARRAWDDRSGPAGAALRTTLLPASALFRLGAKVHHGLYDAGVRRANRASIPVISVGNLRVGGAGKTPFTRWVVERLVALGRHPAVLHGGYGSDEPALHGRWHPEVPVIVGRERSSGVEQAARAGCDVAVLDDGFQHRRLARDLDIVLLAAEHGANRIRLLPRGPWREPLAALRRAGVVVVTRKTASRADSDEVIRYLRETIERRALPARIEPAGWTTIDGARADAPTGPVVGVASTAEPDSFFMTLERMDVEVADRLAFADHHDFDERDAGRIASMLKGRALALTEKDAVKLCRFDALSRAEVRVLGQRVVIEEGEEELVQRIEGALTR